MNSLADCIILVCIFLIFIEIELYDLLEKFLIEKILIIFSYYFMTLDEENIHFRVIIVKYM